jgi:hypothetical protein
MKWLDTCFLMLLVVSSATAQAANGTGPGRMGSSGTTDGSMMQGGMMMGGPMMIACLLFALLLLVLLVLAIAALIKYLRQ